jgi:serine/threonine-protein kinase
VRSILADGAPLAVLLRRPEESRHGIVHRDVTLANVFRLQRDDDPDFIELVDFGIARMTPAESAESGTRLTTEIEVFGTPAFMAPEQVRRTLDADPRSDIYSAGIILFALLTGRMPFAGRSATHVLEQQVHKPPPPPSCFVDSIPRAAEAVVLRALEKDPDRRFQSAEELAAAIVSVDDASSTRSRRAASRRDNWSLVLGGLALIVALWLAFE